MVDEVMDSMNEPAAAAEPVVALPEVPAIEAAEPVAPIVEAQPVAEAKSKPVKARKVKTKSAKPVEAPSVPAAVAAEPAKPVKAPKMSVKPAKAPTKIETRARAAKLPAKAIAPVPAVKPASKRPYTATPRVKTPSVKTIVDSVKAAAPKKELFAMATTTTEFTDKLQTAFKGASEKAKAAFGDAGSFTKGNVEAMVESSKILATGLQDMTKGYVAETKTSFETMTADVKDLASVKSPTEFFEKQSALLRKNFDAAVAASSKNSEAMLKLVNEAFQPISTRVSLAVEKIKQAA
ncbi:MAG: phasin [Novosphingobium sp.]|nr:phasin [Novosphingobium sp.]